MKKIMTSISVAWAISLLVASSALALLPNHDYNVIMSTLSEPNQLTMMEEIAATSDTNGKLSFHFSNIPDSSTAPFLMVEIFDMVNGQPVVVRQNLIPAPEVGQALRMGMNETNHRQTQASMRAFSDAGRVDPLLVMFPVTMMPGSALSADDVSNLGMMANTAGNAFKTYMTQSGVSTTQMAAFTSGLIDAMHDLAANSMLAVDELDPTTATNLQGHANGLFMQAMIDAAAVGGIDSEIMTSAFDRARVAMDNSQGAMLLSASGLAMFDSSYMTSRQQMTMQSQLQQYTTAMSMFNLDADQLQVFIDAKTTLNAALLQAREAYHQLFYDPANPPDQTMIDQAQTDFTAAMQTAMDTFMLTTQASGLQIDTMLGLMASNMTDGMMGGGMMSGNDLGSMGFGQFQARIGSAQQNWSIMMVAGSHMATIAPTMDYVPVTDALLLELSQLQATPNLPVIPDWSILPDDATRSLLHLQFDLMLTSMIESQQQDNLSGMMNSLDLAQINTQHMTNRQTIRQGLQGLTGSQSNALMAIMGPMHII